MENDGPGILRVLWRLLGSEADVMDAYQDCFCKLASRKSAKGLRSARAYAYRTATNIAIELIRGRSRRRAHLPEVAAKRERELSEEAAEEGDEGRLDALRDAIGRLPAHLANVVVLRDLSRLSYQDVGRTLGIDPATARVYRRHAVVKLAELLDEGEES
jgi:RNA polymerase sigma-70 factor (ECF subfamily)